MIRSSTAPDFEPPPPRTAAASPLAAVCLLLCTLLGVCLVVPLVTTAVDRALGRPGGLVARLDSHQTGRGLRPHLVLSTPDAGGGGGGDGGGDGESSSSSSKSSQDGTRRPALMKADDYAMSECLGNSVLPEGYCPFPQFCDEGHYGGRQRCGWASKGRWTTAIDAPPAAVSSSSSSSSSSRTGRRPTARDAVCGPLVCCDGEGGLDDGIGGVGTDAGEDPGEPAAGRFVGDTPRVPLWQPAAGSDGDETAAHCRYVDYVSLRDDDDDGSGGTAGVSAGAAAAADGEGPAPAFVSSAFRRRVWRLLRGRTLVIVGDSVQRQLLQRMVALIRGDYAVVEHDFHTNAVYVMSDTHDYYHVADDAAHAEWPFAPSEELVRIVYVWAPGAQGEGFPVDVVLKWLRTASHAPVLVAAHSYWTADVELGAVRQSLDAIMSQAPADTTLVWVATARRHWCNAKKTDAELIAQSASAEGQLRLEAEDDGCASMQLAFRRRNSVWRRWVQDARRRYPRLPPPRTALSSPPLSSSLPAERVYFLGVDRMALAALQRFAWQRNPARHINPYWQRSAFRDPLTDAIRRPQFDSYAEYEAVAASAPAPAAAAPGAGAARPPSPPLLYLAGRNRTRDLALLRRGRYVAEFRRIDDFHFQCRWGAMWPKAVEAKYIGDALDNACTDTFNTNAVNVLFNILGNRPAPAPDVAVAVRVPPAATTAGAATTTMTKKRKHSRKKAKKAAAASAPPGA